MVRLFEVFAVFCLAVSLLVSRVIAAISCKNDYDIDVDWFFLYKLPHGAINMKYNAPYAGTRYLYVDSNTWTSKLHWELSRRNITDSNSALAYTIFPLTAPSAFPNLVYTIYNDEVERIQHQGYGHTKGILMYDEQRVVWITHSVPSFPYIVGKNEYQYPTNGLNFAQTVFCATFKLEHLATIVTHVFYQRPYFYPPRSEKERRILRHLQEYFYSQNIPSDGTVMVSWLQDAAKTWFVSFAKPSNYIEDVYSGVVAPTLMSHLLVSTWRNGAGVKVPRHINDSRIVDNIERLTFNLGSQGWVVVNNPSDHSKWAITVSRTNRYVCVGTLNRMFSQYTRGGETLCFINEWLYLLLCTSLLTEKECLPRS